MVHLGLVLLLCKGALGDTAGILGGSRKESGQRWQE